MNAPEWPTWPATGQLILIGDQFTADDHTRIRFVSAIRLTDDGWTMDDFSGVRWPTSGWGGLKFLRRKTVRITIELPAEADQFWRQRNPDSIRAESGDTVSPVTAATLNAVHDHYHPGGES